MSSIAGILGAQRASSNFRKTREDSTGIGPVSVEDELLAETEAANVIATICTTTPAQRSQEQIEQLIQTLLVYPFFGQLPDTNMYTFSKHATLANISNGQEIRFDRHAAGTSLKPTTPSSLLRSSNPASAMPAPATPARRVWVFLLQGHVSQYVLKEASEGDGLFASTASKKLVGSFLAGDCIAMDPFAPLYTEADSLACMLVVPEAAFGDMSHLITAYSSFRSFFCSRPCDRSLSRIHYWHKELQRAFPRSEFLKDVSAEDAVGLLRYARWNRPKTLLPLYTQGSENSASFFVLSGTVEYLHQPQGTEVDVTGFQSGTATLKKAFGKPWSKPLVSGDVVGDVPCAADASSRRNTNEHTAITKTHDVMLLRFDIQLFGLYQKCNGIFDPDALCHLLKQPAAVRSSSEAVALCNLMETITFCQVIPPQLMFEWCRMLEFSTFQENDILQEQNSFHFSDFAVFVIISGTVHEHSQPDTQDPDFERFKEHINTILPLQKDQHAAKALTSAARTDYLGPFIRSIGVGEVFGDRGILSKRCRQSTVIADSSRVRCMKITRKKFTEFTKLMPSLAAQPDVVWQLMQTHADRRSEQEKSELLVQLQRLPAFSALPADTIADIASASRGSSFNIGDVVLPIDDDSRYFGIILEGEMASFSRDEAALAAFPGMQVNKCEGSNKIEQERLKLMQQRYGTVLQKYAHGSIVGVGALWLPETSCVARLDSSAALEGKGEQDASSDGIPTVYETVAVKGSRVRRTMSFVSMTKGLQVIIVDAQALNSAKSVLKNTESFMPSQLLAALERPPNLRNFHERLSLTAYLLTFKYCQRLPASTVSDLAKHVEVALRKKGECVQRQGVRPSTFFLTFKGSVSLFRVPHPPRRDDDDDDDDLRWGDEGASQHGSGFEEDHAKTKSRGGSPRSKGAGSRHGSKRLSPSPPRTAAMCECAVPSTADTDVGLAGADDGEDFAGIFGNKIGCVGVGSPIDELALVTNSLSPFTAVVTSQIARFFTLPSSVYSALLQRFHREELSKLCKDLIQRVPVFRSWALPKVMNLIRFFEPKQYFRGQTLMSQSCNQKNEHRRIIIILDGNCAVEADLPRSFDHTLESEIKLRQKEELEDESLRSLSFSHDSSPKTGVRKIRQLKRAVITMFGHSTVLLDGFASQPLSYDVVAIEGVSCLELSGEEFSKVSNSTLEYIAEQESITNSWRSTVVAKLAVIRAPDFSLTKAVTEVDVDSIIDAINAKKKQEQRAARERSISPKDKSRRNIERQKGATVASEHEVSLQPSKHSSSPTMYQRGKHGQSALEATLVPNFQSPSSNSFGTVARASFEASSKVHSQGSDDWWTSMGIEGMQSTKSVIALQASGLDAPHLSPATAAAVTPTREHVRATFGVKPPSLSGTKQTDFFLKAAQQKHALEQQAALVQTSLGDWARITNKCAVVHMLLRIDTTATLVVLSFALAQNFGGAISTLTSGFCRSSTVVINTPDGKLHSMQLSQVARASRLSMVICNKNGNK